MARHDRVIFVQYSEKRRRDFSQSDPERRAAQTCIRAADVFDAEPGFNLARRKIADFVAPLEINENDAVAASLLRRH